MRSLPVTNTSIDLSKQKVPFLPNYTVIAKNPVDTGTLVLQHSDDNTNWSTLVSLPASSEAQVNLDKRYIRCSTAATIYLNGN